jgi:hypothetical protein
LTINPTPVPSSTVAFTSFVNCTRNVSSGSSCVSPLTETETFFVVSPGANVSVPPVAE